MKKKINAKRIIACFAMLALLLGLASCGNKTFECDLCGKEKTGKSHQVEALGQEITVCEDCYKEIKG